MPKQQLANAKFLASCYLNPKFSIAAELIARANGKRIPIAKASKKKRGK